MTFDRDVVLCGNGIATLVAAYHLISQGKSILILNPDWDFFLEKSELPFDPFFQDPFHSKSLLKSQLTSVLESLNPFFPGALESWNSKRPNLGYHDQSAPHVRERDRIWISSHDPKSYWKWETLEDIFVEASDLGLHPKILDGIAGMKRFPGFSGNSITQRSLLIPQLCDVDIVRYQNGLLEFVRERIGNSNVVCAAHQVELTPEGVKFQAKGIVHTAKLKDGILIFQTPRLNRWITHQLNDSPKPTHPPLGVRLWEQWSIFSKKQLDPSVVGIHNQLSVWADFEGTPESGRLNRLSVLKRGPLVKLETLAKTEGGLHWATSESFSTLSKFFSQILNWDQFSVRSLSVRALFEWNSGAEPWMLTKRFPPTWVIPKSDGPLFEVVETAKKACQKLDRGGAEVS